MTANMTMRILSPWLVLALLVGLLVNQAEIRHDLTQFFPDDSHQLIRHQLDKSLHNPWLILFIEGEDSSQLAQLSQQLKTRLLQQTFIQQVKNGAFDENPSHDTEHPLFAYRYLLSDIKQPIETHMRDRWQEWRLGVVPDKTMLLADPTYTWQRYLGRLRPPQNLDRTHGVWLLPGLPLRALMLIEVRQPFGAQQADQLQQMLREAAPNPMTLTGPAWIANASQHAIEHIIQQTSLLISLLVGGLLLWVFRSIRTLVLVFVPLLSALMGGALAVQWSFGGIQALTLALGSVLIGVAVDYPIHVAHAGGRRQHLIWRALMIGWGSTLLGFGALLLSDIEGLQQLAVFSLAGLSLAMLMTWLMLPVLGRRDHGPTLLSPQVIARPWHIKDSVLAGLLGVCLAFVIIFPNQTDTRLFSLGAIPQSLITADQEARQALGMAEVGQYLWVARNASIEHLLQSEEALVESLDELVAQGAFSHYQMLADWLPSAALQRVRQAKLPGERIIHRALTDLPLTPEHFQTFINDIQQSRTLPALSLSDYAALMPELSPDQLLLRTEQDIVGLIPLTQVQDADSIRRFADTHPHVAYIDQRQIVREQFNQLSDQVIQLAAGGLIAIVVFLVIWLRSPIQALKRLLPCLLSIGFTLILLSMVGQALSIFHIIALLLVAAISLDYSVLLHSRPDTIAVSAWLSVIAVAYLTSTLAFLTLGFSDLFILNALGLTVAVGISLAFVLAYWQTKSSVAR